MTSLPKLTVLGTGYLGAVHAVAMASIGYEVLGMDVDEAKIKLLSNGETPFHEPGLPELLSETLATGRLRFTTSYEEVAEFGDVHFLCVGTPQKKGEYAADMTYVDAVTAGLIPHLKRPALIAGKSTVPVGTAERLREWVQREAPAGEAIKLSWNPEFLREGFAVEDTLRPDRLVFGVSSQEEEDILRSAFQPILDLGTPLVVTDLATAQLVKVAANSFLATKISFINAMAEVCEATHADVKKLSEALSHDTRIGGRFLHAGLGFGGGCLPKDIRAFMARAGELGVDQALSFLREVDAINLRRRARVIDLVYELTEDHVKGSKIACLGATFKPNTDDVRDSPALDVAATLHERGAQVTVYDPAGNETARLRHPELTYATSAVEAAREADVVLHLTEWSEFREMDPSTLSEVVHRKHIVDGRNALDPKLWREAGWTYRALGRP